MARLVRLLMVAAALAALAASSSSSHRAATPAPAAGAWSAPPPAGQPMDARVAGGLWKSTFGAVKVEQESTGRLHGVWTYDRQGQQVVGYFGGALDGNVLRLTWREPARPVPGAPQLEGEGWLAFDPNGSTFTGRWWTSARDRQGDWNGWRLPGNAGATGGYGGATYGVPPAGSAPTQPPPPPPPGGPPPPPSRW